MQSIKQHLNDVKAMINGNVIPNSKFEKTSIARKSLTEELAKLNKQKTKLYDLLEREVYTDEMFAERFSEVTKRISETKEALSQLPEEKPQRDLNEYCLMVQSVLDTYSEENTPAENNEILSQIISKIKYYKTEGGRWKQSNLKIDIEFKL